MPGTKKSKGEWGVRDRNARTLADDNTGTVVPRIHEVRPGLTVPLTFDAPCYMREADARVFLKDASFIVTDADDNVVAPLSEAAMRRSAPTELPPNMCVADVNELTSEALLTRAAQLPGGTTFNPNTPREVLIRFIVDDNSGAHNKMRPQADQRDDDGEVEDEMDPDAAQKLLEGG